MAALESRNRRIRNTQRKQKRKTVQERRRTGPQKRRKILKLAWGEKRENKGNQREKKELRTGTHNTRGLGARSRLYMTNTLRWKHS